jgi:hypothetical protein
MQGKIQRTPLKKWEEHTMKNLRKTRKPLSLLLIFALLAGVLPPVASVEVVNDPNGGKI